MRGHLAKTTKGCSSFYSEEELILLDKHAKSVHKENTAKWKKDNREAANEHEKWRYHKTPEKEKERKREYHDNIGTQSTAQKAIYVKKHLPIRLTLIVTLMKFTIISLSLVPNAPRHSSERTSYEIILMPHMVLSIASVM